MKRKYIGKMLVLMTAFVMSGPPMLAKADEPVRTGEDLERIMELSQTAFSQTDMVEDFHKRSRKMTVQEASKAKYTYSDEELYILAHVICGEAQSYSDEEQLYVGSVVLNRVNHGSYPNTIKGVVFQKNQYSCTRDGNYYRTPTERNWANARYLLENGSVLPANVVYQSGGRQGKGAYLKTSRHYYCYY